MNPVFDAHTWAAVPFQFWAAVFFGFGCIVGSFLNVCIHRMPLGESIVSPPSHCPHCRYSIPWYLNIPLVTWVYLGGKCRNCGAPITVRYFLVELLTGLAFLACWMNFGAQSVGLAIVYCIFLSGLIAATFIDFEHFIIPDEITIGGIVAGCFASLLVVAMHRTPSPVVSLKAGIVGAAVGAGLVYAILRVGKLLFGRQRLSLPPGAKVIFSETEVILPDRAIGYEELFYRRSDTIKLRARTVELVDRCYRNVEVLLNPTELRIGGETLVPESVPHLEAEAEEIVLPREAMGLGDVKFMAAIGAFLGWQAVVFSLMISSVIGSLVGVGLIVCRKREWSSRLPYGPYIALAAAIWIFGGSKLVHWWFGM